MSFFSIETLFLIVNKLFYYPSYIFDHAAEILNILLFYCLKIFKIIFKSFRQLKIKKYKIYQRKITPNLTLYYPLPTSILSVSIRFMGAILLILIFFCASFFLLITIYQINFQILSLFLTIIVYLTISSFIYHILNSLSHFLKN